MKPKPMGKALKFLIENFYNAAANAGPAEFCGLLTIPTGSRFAAPLFSFKPGIRKA